MAHFDLIIVGTGVAGRTGAEDAKAAGLTVALADHRPFGGTCALRGCEPKKVLFAAAETVRRAIGQAGNGVAGDVHLDWAELIAFKRRFTEPLSEVFETEFADLGVTKLHGVARFLAPDAIEIGGETHSATAFLLAPGAVPTTLGIPGEELLIYSEQFMELDSLPPRIVFIGGGFISFELAGIAAAAGATCTILHRGAQPLREFDPDLVRMLIAHYADLGIQVHTDAPVIALRHTRANGQRAAFAVDLADGSAIATDLVVHGAGRVPDLAVLDLPAGCVSFSGAGIEVDTGLRSLSNPSVFAAGDAAALGPALTPVGVAQAHVAVRNIISPGSATFDPAVIPSVVFSQPPLASVGLSERASRDAVDEVDVKLTDTSGWLSAQRVGLTHTGAKILSDRVSGRLIGAHVLGHNAEELINLFALSIAQGLTADDLRAILWAYPTATSEIVYLV